MRNKFWLIAGIAFAMIAPGVFGDEAADAFASAEAKYRHGQYKEALAEYQAFQQRFPKDWRAEQAQFTAAFILERKIKDAPKAAAAYQTMTVLKASAPVSRIAKFHMAAAYVKAGEIQKAIAVYEELRASPEGTRIREINRAIRLLRKTTSEETADPHAWGEKLKGKKWRKLKKLGGEE